ncbi:MAG: histidinol-phosphate transaminase [Pyrinomonadaceae bacterium]
MAFELNKLVRENIQTLAAYSTARSEFNDSAEVWLDANENGFGSPLERNYNRYPDPLQIAIKQKLAELNGVNPDEIFVGNGSDEAIDLAFRIFCSPGVDNAVICPPTYGMYEVSANINDVAIKRVSLTADFDLDTNAVREAIDANTKLIFLCSPNNPTGNLVNREPILEIARNFNGIVILDEAYIHFSKSESLVSEIHDLPNLIVLQTFSKAWGLAGLRVGLAFAAKETIAVFNKIKPPYNVSQIAQERVLSALDNVSQVAEIVAQIVREREILAKRLSEFSFVERVYPSDANFLLVKTSDANGLYEHLVRRKIVVRNRSNILLCEGCLRITVGTPQENGALLEALVKYEKGIVH